MSNQHRRTGARPSRALQSFPIPEVDHLPTDTQGHRQARLERVLHEELQTILRDEVADPGLDGLAVIAVELSPDGGHARVAYVIEGSLSDEQACARRSRQALSRAIGFLRSRLAGQLDLKRLPKLSFAFVGVRPAGALDAGEGGGP